MYSVAISSNNTNNQIAVPGDIVTLLFTSSEEIVSPSVIFKSGGLNINSEPVISNPSFNNWTAVFTVNSDDRHGLITFQIDYLDLANNSGLSISHTTDNSSVMISNGYDPSPSPSNTVDVSSDPSPIVTAIITSTPIPTPTLNPTYIPTNRPTPASSPSYSPTGVPISNNSSTANPITSENRQKQDIEYGEVELYNLKIKIYNKNKPLAGIKLVLYSFIREGVTDVHGEAIFEKVEEGIHNLKIYTDEGIVEKEITVKKGEKDINMKIDIAEKKQGFQYWQLLVPSFMLILLTVLMYKKTSSKDLG